MNVVVRLSAVRNVGGGVDDGVGGGVDDGRHMISAASFGDRPVRGP
jgi:hypothetical protein